MSFAAELKGAAAPEREALYWHYPHYHPGGATPYSAARFGDWRVFEFFETGKVELYNLKDDIGEKTDLAARKPVVAKAVKLMGGAREDHPDWPLRDAKKKN